MSKIYVVHGVHFEVPGTILSAHRTEAAANVAAAELVNIMLNELEIEQTANARNWADLLDLVNGSIADDDEAHVCVMELDLED